jgi:hypothetical protein
MRSAKVAEDWAFSGGHALANSIAAQALAAASVEMSFRKSCSSQTARTAATSNQFTSYSALAALKDGVTIY